jgi:hypothetical protein
MEAGEFSEDSKDSSDTELTVRRPNFWARKVGIAGLVFLVAVAFVGAGVKVFERSHSAPVGDGAALATVQELIEVKPPGKTCSKVGEECGGTRCCILTGYECYNKNSTFNGCAKECPSDSTDGWTCNRPQSLIPTKPGSVEPSVSGPSLFCFEVFAMDPGWPKKKPHELELVRTQLQTGTSIFGCSDWRVFADQKVEISPGTPGRDPPLYTVAVDFPHIGLRKGWNTWINTPIFKNLWGVIRQEKLFEKHQWTVKVDVDAVFFPARLSNRLAGQEVTPGGIFFVNCRYVKDGFFGALEVMSRVAIQTFLDNIESCDKSLNWTTPGALWGEDKFAQRCMEAHGVDAVEDLKLISDGLCDQIEERSKLAKQKGVPYSSIKTEVKVQKCHDSHTIAFHPLRRPYDYFECVKNAQA